MVTTTDTIKVLIVDDSAVVRQVLTKELGSVPGIETRRPVGHLRCNGHGSGSIGGSKKPRTDFGLHRWRRNHCKRKKNIAGRRL